MSQNAEAAVRIDQANVSAMGFSWGELLDKMFHQGWDIYRLEQSDIIDKRSSMEKIQSSMFSPTMLN